MRFYALMLFENIRRNIVRTVLTSLGTIVLVLVVTLVFTVLNQLNIAVTEKQSNLKAIITEKWQIPSQMPYSYAAGLSDGAARSEDDVHPEDWMTWGFYAGSVEPDPKKRSFKDLVFGFIIDPVKLNTMMDGLDDLKGQEKVEFDAAVQRFAETRNGIILGPDRLNQLQKRVGDKIKLFGRNFKDIDFEVEIVGVFPPGRYDLSGAFRRDMFNDAMDQYQRNNKGKAHPLAGKTLNLVWLRFQDREQFQAVTDQILESPEFTDPAVKCETSSSGISTFLDSYRDLIFGMKWLLAPACLITLSLVIANAISISVRERNKEFAIFKVLGFRPDQILTLVILEAILIGAGSGFLGVVLVYGFFNGLYGGIPFPVAFFTKFPVPVDVLWWGPAIGGVTALLGGIIPAIQASWVKVSEVFSRVA